MPNRTQSWLLIALVVSVAGGFACAASGQTSSGDPALGRELALRRCSACHDLERHRIRATRTAPDFPEIAARRASTDVNLRGSLRQRHVPELMLGAGAMEDIVAYILSLRNPGTLPDLPARQSSPGGTR